MMFFPVHIDKYEHEHDWTTDDFHMEYCADCGEYKV